MGWRRLTRDVGWRASAGTAVLGSPRSAAGGLAAARATAHPDARFLRHEHGGGTGVLGARVACLYTVYRFRAARASTARGACRSIARRQRGAYAIEFAFTFLILFAVTYAGIALAVAFAGNQLMAVAAEDGARAALRAGTLAQKQTEACRVAEGRADLFSGSCVALLDNAGPACAMSSAAGGECLHVRVTAPMPIPQVPLFNVVLPAQLAGQATVRLESSGGGGVW